MRSCGSCTLCCQIAAVSGNGLIKAAHQTCPHLKSGSGCCKLFASPNRPEMCSTFWCAWARGYGSEEDRPDKTNVLVHINKMNGGAWIFAIEAAPDALPQAKSVVLSLSAKAPIPTIVVDYAAKPPHDFGNRVIVKKALLGRSSKLIGKFLAYLDNEEEYGIYELVVT